MTKHNFLIVRTDRLGDVVLSLPLAKIIKDNYPDSQVTFLLREYTKRLALGNKFIDNIIILEEKNGKPNFFRNINVLKDGKFDTCITVYPTFLITLILFLSGIKNRIGTGYRWYSFLFNKKFYEHRKDAKKNELEYNINLLNTIGINHLPVKGEIDFGISVVDEDDLRVDRIMSDYGIERAKPLVIIHPGSGGSAVDLPSQKYRELISMLVNINIEVCVTGNNNEKEICNKISEGFPVKNLVGKFDLSELISLVNKSFLFISNSTGPLHIAAALGKNVIGFYPKIKACSKERWGPYSQKAVIFEPTINCGNCSREQCERLDCMNSIDINIVFSYCEKLVNSFVYDDKSFSINGDKNEK